MMSTRMLRGTRFTQSLLTLFSFVRDHIKLYKNTLSRISEILSRISFQRKSPKVAI